MKVEPLSDELNVKTALVDATVPDGPESIAVSGGVLSMVHVRDAGVGSTFPAPSRARTANVCVPSPKPEYIFGDTHAANPEPFNEHSNDAPTVSDENVKVALLALVADGGAESILVSGAVVSTVHVWTAGDASTFPAVSVARTENVCTPSASPWIDVGDVHGVNGAPSSEHPNVDVSVAEKANVAVDEDAAAGGAESIEVFGAIES